MQIKASVLRSIKFDHSIIRCVAMTKWFFPTRGYGATEGFSNPALETFKGSPISSMAREICQNSLDAVRDQSKPVLIEFDNKLVSCRDFPGIVELKDIFEKCKEFWKDQSDDKAKDFIEKGLKELSENKIYVLRVSDYNTIGLKGAFSDDNNTPWKSLVQGTSFSVKSSQIAAGSFGIGKAAPFVVSKLQTVFYRTYDENNVRAAQGVTQLVSFKDPEMSKPEEDVVRRATGYYCEGAGNVPFKTIEALDNINIREECGTDIFIPAFKVGNGEEWIKEIIIEILNNFLYSIYSGKLIVKIGKYKLNKDSIRIFIEKCGKRVKHAAAFYEVIRENNPDVIEETTHLLNSQGTLRLRLLYKPELNKQILVVRNSGMKIAEIKGLPKTISYTGFLEIVGEDLNSLFRSMENPQHNAWEPKRSITSSSAANYKEALETWVKQMISQKIKDSSGDSIDVDTSGIISGKENTSNVKSEEESNENEKILDSTKNLKVVEEEIKPKTIKIRDKKNGNGEGEHLVKGKITDNPNDLKGHRTRTGKTSHSTPSGRTGVTDSKGPDKIYSSPIDIELSARIISKGRGVNKLIFKAHDDISFGEIEVVTTGENGRTLPIEVNSVVGLTAEAEARDGHIVIKNIKAGEKYTLEFSIYSNKTYAMGVKAYENRK